MPAAGRVWDPLVRIGHWSLVACVAAAWFASEGYGVWHERIGYAALAIICMRVAWGFAGPHSARFKEFVRSPAAILDYARHMATASEPRHLGHNPLGGWMIVLLLIVIALVGLSGWLYTTDRYWGVEWVGELHEALADALLVLIALHVGGESPLPAFLYFLHSGIGIENASNLKFRFCRFLRAAGSLGRLNGCAPAIATMIAASNSAAPLDCTSAIALT